MIRLFKVALAITITLFTFNLNTSRELSAIGGCTGSTYYIGGSQYVTYSSIYNSGQANKVQAIARNRTVYRYGNLAKYRQTSTVSIVTYGSQLNSVVCYTGYYN